MASLLSGTSMNLVQTVISIDKSWQISSFEKLDFNVFNIRKHLCQKSIFEVFNPYSFQTDRMKMSLPNTYKCHKTDFW